MSDIMRPIPFSQLMNWIIEEHKTQGAVFGVRKMVTTNQEGALPIFDERIETPFGPAAGPNTQLAQNIVASYVAGSRFFELKTVQVMDGEELSKCVNKPCIVAQDECYNCEWSTELEVPQAFAEYVKAWFACHLIAREYGLGSPDGFVFNMSVGYDLEGIKSPKVDAYIEGIAQADANGHDLKHIGSVASFFVSRVDTAVDKLLEANGSDEAKALEGKAAVANARLAYELFENKFANDPRWAALEAKGAKKQRPLWASTGTKNAAYSDCKYVDELVAPFVVNTMPEKTLNALADHGNGAPSIKGTYEESHAIMNKLADLGINIKDVTDKLEADGVAAFIKSWDTVLADVQAGIDRVNG